MVKACLDTLMLVYEKLLNEIPTLGTITTFVRLSRISGKMSFSNGALIPSRLVATFEGSDLLSQFIQKIDIKKWDFKVCSGWFSVVYKTLNV